MPIQPKRLGMAERRGALAAGFEADIVFLNAAPPS
jgi:imidazolonepropionase-like amidohydrolase